MFPLQRSPIELFKRKTPRLLGHTQHPLAHGANIVAVEALPSHVLN